MQNTDISITWPVRRFQKYSKCFHYLSKYIYIWHALSTFAGKRKLTIVCRRELLVPEKPSDFQLTIQGVVVSPQSRARPTFRGQAVVNYSHTVGSGHEIIQDHTENAILMGLQECREGWKGCGVPLGSFLMP